MCIRKYLIIALLFSFSFSLAQQPASTILDSISLQFISNIRLKQTERSFMVTDRSVYKAGENLWLRIFLLRSASQKMSGLSKNLFLELVDEKDSVFSILLLDVRTGILNARMYLPPSIPTGFYWIRAYTKYMAEVETNKIAIQPIYIVNSALLHDNGSRLVRKSNGDPDAISMQLFPEGGTLMTSTNSTVAFHIVDGRNDAVVTSGVIKDNRDTVVAQFTSDSYGLGKFEFIPSRGRQYFAHINWKGKDMAYPLPPFNFFAGQLSVINEPNGGRKIRVLLEDSIYQKNFKTYLVGIAKDSLCFASIGSGMYEVPIPEQKFPGGIATFYLLDERQHLLSERSVYFNDNLIMKATLDKDIYKKRDKSELSISITDAQNRPLPASLSIVVVDSSLVRSENTSSVVSRYFENRDQLSSDNWSLSSADLTASQLDMLMMARNRSYSDIMLDTNKPHFYTDSDSLLYIRGNAFYAPQKPAANKIATLLSRSFNTAYDVDTTNDNGRFIFPLIEYPDSTRFIIQLSSAKGNVEQTDVTLDKLNFPKIRSALPKDKFSIRPADVNNYLRDYPDTISAALGDSLSEVTVKGYKKKEPTYDASKRVNPNSKIITSRDIGRGANGVTNAFLRVPGVQVVNGFVVIMGLARFAPPNASTEPAIFLDGAQVFPNGGLLNTASPVLSYLDVLNPDDVSFIEVLTGPDAASYGMRGANGVILINSKNANEDPGSNTLNSYLVRGYHIPPPFIMPDYSNAKMKAAKFNDVRSTLYWNPLGITDQQGQLKVAFFTSDVHAAYKVIIDGVTIRGDVIHKVISFKTE